MRLASLRLLAAALLLAAPAAAQAPEPEPEEPPPGLPTMDIYLAPLNWVDGAPALGEVVNATARPGYDNQPSFLPGAAAFLYTAETDDGSTDIWRYDIASGAAAAVIETAGVGEYSPQRPPGGDAHVSVVRQDAEGVQNVYRFDEETGAYEPVLDLDPVGYYAWARGGDALVMFVLGEPPTLQLYDLETGALTTVHEDIGRAIHALPDGSGVLFTAPRDDDGYTVMRLDLSGDELAAAPLFDLPGLTQDFATVPVREPGGEIGYLAASADGLSYRAGESGEWVVIADLEALAIYDATRLAVDAEASWIAIVGFD